MKKIVNCLIVAVVCCISAPSIANRIYIENNNQLYAVVVKLQPGDTVVFRKGIYPDLQLVLTRHGSSKKPIVMLAENPGSVIISGNAKVAMYGSYNELNGFYFTNGNRDTAQWKSHGPGLVALYASHCRVTQCAFNNFDEANSAWITTSLDAQGKVPVHCRIDHCSFTNKVTFDQVINLNNKLSPDKENPVGGTPMYHRVDHCFFSNPKKKGNAGGGIRIGYYRNDTGRCRIDSNVFIRQDSEPEIITSKSMENVFHGNTFLNCQGTLNFRHGDNQVAINNYFLSDDEKYGYGGLFVWGSKHIIAGNYFSLGKTITSRGNAAIYLNCGPAASEHALAFGSIIANNVFVNNNGHAIHFNPLEELRKIFSKENKLVFEVPHDIVLSNNVFYSEKNQGYPFFRDDYKTRNRNNNWRVNTFWGSPTGLDTIPGLEEREPVLVNRNGFSFLKNNNSAAAISCLPGAYDSIEGIPLKFDQVVRRTVMQQPLRLEEILPGWMFSTLGDYYKTGELTAELEARLKRVAEGRE